jgi:uncharacterized protein YciI
MKLCQGIAFCMIILSLCPLAPVFSVYAGEQAKEEYVTYYWGFFVRGMNQEKLPEEEGQKMQKAHIANLEKLHSEGKLLMAGPLGNAGNMRGIVVMDVKTPEEVQACFKDDPFVKAGRLEMQAYKWLTTKGAIKEADQPMKMAEYRLGLIRKGASWSPESTSEIEKLQEGHMNNIRKMAAAGILAMAGPLSEAGELRGIFVFRSKDDKMIQDMTAADPSLQAGRLKLELYQLFMAEGVLGR